MTSQPPASETPAAPEQPVAVADDPASETGPAAAPAAQPQEHPCPRSVVLAGGGTAGHVSPLLALADALRRRNPDVRITVLGTEHGLEARLVPARGYELRTIPKVVFPRSVSASALRLPSSLKGAVDAAAAIIREADADVVVGFGGYVSSPAYLAARRLGVPIVVHEQNTRPGLANRLGARLTRFVATTFAATRLPHARHLGMPLRREISTLDRAACRDEAMTTFGLSREWPTILVTGGSSGARRINEAFAGAARELSDAGLQVFHVTGLGKGFDLPEFGHGAPYVVAEYCDRMDLAYAAADLVVSRAGAGMVSELTAVGLPAVYVPLPIGNGEQRFNVADVVAGGGGVVVDDEHVSPEWVTRELVPLALDRHRVATMAARAASIGTRSADDALADLVEEACSSRKEGRR